MVILFPVQTCDYNYCDGVVNHRQILKCDRTKCEGNHPKLEKIKRGPNIKANQYLRYALQNSREVRFEQEKLQTAQDNIFKQIMRNSANFHHKNNNNSYNSVSNLAVNDRKYVFHFRPKPKPKVEKHLALGRIPKPKPKVQI